MPVKNAPANNDTPHKNPTVDLVSSAQHVALKLNSIKLVAKYMITVQATNRIMK